MSRGLRSSRSSLSTETWCNLRSVLPTDKLPPTLSRRGLLFPCIRWSRSYQGTKNAMSSVAIIPAVDRPFGIVVSGSHPRGASKKRPTAKSIERFWRSAYARWENKRGWPTGSPHLRSICSTFLPGSTVLLAARSWAPVVALTCGVAPIP